MANGPSQQQRRNSRSRKLVKLQEPNNRFRLTSVNETKTTLMKKFILIAALAIAGLTGLVPTTSRAGIFIELGDRPYYRGEWYYGPGRHVRYYWVPGNWVWRWGHRVWIHGHYVERYRW